MGTMVRPEVLAPPAKMSSPSEEVAGLPADAAFRGDTLIKNDHDFGTPNTDSQFLLGPGNTASAVNSYLGYAATTPPSLKRVRLSGSGGGALPAGNRVLLLNSSINGRGHGAQVAGPPQGHHTYLTTSSATVRRTYAAQAAQQGPWSHPVAVDGEGLASVTTTPSFSLGSTFSSPGRPGGSRLPPTAARPLLLASSSGPPRLSPLVAGPQYFHYRPPPPRKRQPRPKKPKKKAPESSGQLLPSINSAAKAQHSPVPPMPEAAPLMPQRPEPVVVARPDETPIRQSRLERRSLSLNERLGQLVLLGAAQYQTAEQMGRLASESGACLELPSTSAASPSLVAASPPKRPTKNAARDALLERKLASLIDSGELRRLGLKREELLAKTPAELARWIKRYDLRRIHELLPASAAHSFTMGRGQIGLTTEEVAEVRRGSEALSAHVRDLEMAYDSEATEDSSGGESCDELDADLRGHHEPPKKRRALAAIAARNPPPLRQRAKFAAAAERAFLGSRWAWVQSTIGDLEYRIRQAADLSRQLRAKKSAVRLLPSPGDSCARTRPLAAPLPRRHLLRPAGSFGWGGRLGQASSLPCACAPPLPPCLRCAGRIAAVKSSVGIASESTADRQATSDPGFHPALSRREQSLARAVQTNLKAQSDGFKVPHRKRTGTAGVGSQKLLGTSLKNGLSSNQASPNTPGTSTPKNGLHHLSSKGLSRSQPDATPKAAVKQLPHSPLKLKIRLNGLGTPANPAWPEPKGDRKCSKDSLESAVRKVRSRGGQRKRVKKESAGSSGSREASPALSFEDWATGSGPSSPLVGGLLGRRSTIAGAFDIDNIVIDPSVAAATKVQKLIYKEIAIPGWRTLAMGTVEAATSEMPDSVPTLQSPQKPVLAVDDFEDLSDSAFLCRHESREASERLRFAAYKKAVWSGVHSLAESLGGSDSGRSSSPSSRPPSPFPPRQAQPFPRRTFDGPQ